VIPAPRGRTDTFFAVGAVVLGWFVLGLETGWSLAKPGTEVLPGSTEITPTRDRAAEGRA
jgi:nitric oxide reductase subunit B